MRGTGESMETKIGSAVTASISSPLCWVTLSNLIRRVVFKHHLAQLLREGRVGEEELGLGSLGVGNPQPAGAAALEERGTPFPKPGLSWRTAGSLAHPCLERAKGEIKKAQSGVLQS